MLYISRHMLTICDQRWKTKTTKAKQTKANTVTDNFLFCSMFAYFWCFVQMQQGITVKNERHCFITKNTWPIYKIWNNYLFLQIMHLQHILNGKLTFHLCENSVWLFQMICLHFTAGALGKTVSATELDWFCTPGYCALKIACLYSPGHWWVPACLTSNLLCQLIAKTQEVRNFSVFGCCCWHFLGSLSAAGCILW